MRFCGYAGKWFVCLVEINKKIGDRGRRIACADCRSVAHSKVAVSCLSWIDGLTKTQLSLGNESFLTAGKERV